jgi:hypothetical protein
VREFDELTPASSFDNAVNIKAEYLEEDEDMIDPGDDTIIPPMLAEDNVMPPNLSDDRGPWPGGLDSHKVYDHLLHLCNLADKIRAVHTHVADHERRVEHELQEMWEQNSGMRRLQLKGGKARRQRSQLGNYVPYAQTKAAGAGVHENRLYVQKKDLAGRTQAQGLAYAKTLLDQSFQDVRALQQKARAVIDACHVSNTGYADEETIKIIEEGMATVFNERDELELQDIEAMVVVFFEEYDFEKWKILAD